MCFFTASLIAHITLISLIETFGKSSISSVFIFKISASLHLLALNSFKSTFIFVILKAATEVTAQISLIIVFLFVSDLKKYKPRNNKDNKCNRHNRFDRHYLLPPFIIVHLVLGYAVVCLCQRSDTFQPYRQPFDQSLLTHQICFQYNDRNNTSRYYIPK